MPHMLAITWYPYRILAITWHPDPPGPAPVRVPPPCVYSKPIWIFGVDELLRIYARRDWDVLRFDDVDYVYECGKSLHLSEWHDFSLWMSLMKNSSYGIGRATTGRVFTICGNGSNSSIQSEAEREEELRRTAVRERALVIRKKKLLAVAEAVKCTFHTGKNVAIDCELCVAAKQKHSRTSDLPYVMFSDYKKMKGVELAYYIQQSRMLMTGTSSILETLRRCQAHDVHQYGTLHAMQFGAQGIRNLEQLKLQLLLNMSRAQMLLRSYRM